MTNVKIVAVDRDRLRHIADRAVHFRRPNGLGLPVAAPPPVHVIADMMVERPLPLPELRGVVHAPFFTPSGRLVLRSGYDEETKRYLHLPESLLYLTVSEAPSTADVERALGTIRDLLCDFPFASAADEANALAKLLDPFTRTIHDSITPFYVISAPAAGTGKAKLADVLTIPAVGASVMRTPLPTAEAEVGKALLAYLLDGVDHIHFDNFEGTLSSPTLAAFVTSPTYSGRVLSMSKTAELPQRVNLSLSGNNVQLGGDFARRVTLIHLDAGIARPEQRTEFKHPKIEDWATENRGMIVEACLTLIQSWVAAGMRPGSVTKGSFEKWAATTSGILEHAGVGDLEGNREEVDVVADVGADAWERFVGQWCERFGLAEVRPSQLTELLELVEIPPFWVGETATERSLSISLGKALTKVRDRIFGGFRITLCRQDTKSGSRIWKLTPAGS